uniref:Uncharacterized protein n=1 Tax=Caenorhabditis japonica TaxID=281687 RepID=A0A8R1HXE1_CAEJA
MNACFFFALLAVLTCINAQYAAYPAGNSYEKELKDNYMCSYQASYDLIGQFGKHYRSHVNFCQNAYKTDSCVKCCKMAARIQNSAVSENDIIGFNIVLKRQPLCICCAPTGY